MEKKILLKNKAFKKVVTVLLALGSLTSTRSYAQCIATNNVPTGTTNVSPYVQTIISTNMNTGNYAIMNITNAGPYVMNTSISTFITITDNANVVVASGNNPLNFTIASAGMYRVHIHMSASCNTDAATRIVAISPKNRAFNFDGSNDYFTLGTSLNSVLAPLNKITAEAWIYPTTNTGNGNIVGNYSSPANQMQFMIRRASNSYQFFIGNGTGGNYLSANTTNTAVVLNTWQHVAGAWNGTVASIYLNGVLQATASITYPQFNNTTNDIRIGYEVAGGGEPFQGNIDEVRIWTRALCQSEIQNNMNGAIATSGYGLLANYHFNQGIPAGSNSTVTTLIDASGNNFTGTATNMALNGATSNWVISTIFAVDGQTAPNFSYPSVSISGTNAVCAGNSSTLTASGTSSYKWTNGPATNTFVVTPTATSVYTVIGTNAGGCESLPTTYTVTHNALPTITVNNGTICSGNSFTIAPGGAGTYTIQGGNAVVSPGSNASYTVIGTSTAGCLSSNTATSNVTVNQTPTITVNSGTICNGNSFTINPSGAATYTFQGGNAVVNPTTTASYSVIGTSSLGCVSNTAASNVNVNPLPNITATTNNSLICVGESATITANGATSYTWNTSSNSVAVVISPTTSTNYTVTGTDANGCSNTATVTQNVSSCAGIAENGTVRANIKAYPNPFNNKLVIESDQMSMGITIYNSLGDIVFDEKMGSMKVELDLESLSAGIYFVKIGSANLKVLKQ